MSRSGADIQPGRLGTRHFARPSDCLRAAVRGALLREYVLTPRQLEVLEILADGKSTQEIATVLYLSPRSVEDYIHELHVALGTNDRAALVARWLDLIYQAVDAFRPWPPSGLSAVSDTSWPETASATAKRP